MITKPCTLDVSLVDVADGVFEIKSTDGDLDLGGSLIDERIVNWLADEFKTDEGMDLRKDPMALQRLFEASEKAKIELSNSAQTDINLPYVTANETGPKHLVKTLSRAKFDQLISDIIDNTINKAKSALNSSGLKLSEIDDILLVGGSTRIPLVQDRLEREFKLKPNKSLNPDTCVSTGATKQGGVLSGDVTDVLLLDVTPLSLGIETMGGVFTKLIEANTTIPTRKSETFSTASDNQSSVEVHIVQGERSMARDNRSLGRFHLDGVPPAPRGVPQISISLDIDANGILSVTAEDKGTGKKNSIRIEGGSQLSKEDIERMKEDAIANAEADKLEKETIDKLNGADSLIFQTEKQIKELDDKLTDDDKSELEKGISDLREAHSNKNLTDLENYTNSLNESWTKISTRIYSEPKGEDQFTETEVVD